MWADLTWIYLGRLRDLSAVYPKLKSCFDFENKRNYITHHKQQKDKGNITQSLTNYSVVYIQIYSHVDILSRLVNNNALLLVEHCIFCVLRSHDACVHGG